MDSRQRSLLFGTFRATLFIFRGTAFSGAQAVADIDRSAILLMTRDFFSHGRSRKEHNFRQANLTEVYRLEQR
jgi:hypothetical protein